MNHGIVLPIKKSHYVLRFVSIGNIIEVFYGMYYMNLLLVNFLDFEKMPIPEDIFQQQAERRVRLGLVVAELVKTNDLHAKPEQVSGHIEELAASYEKPMDVIRWYGSDKNRMAEVEAIVVENNVTNFVLSKAQVTEKSTSFDELMAQNMKKSGSDEYRISTLLKMFHHYNEHGFIGNPKIISMILGRKPNDFASFLNKAIKSV